MGYRIDYGQENHIFSREKLSSVRTMLLSAAVFICFAAAVKICWSDGWDALKTILFPGNWETAKMAAEDFVCAVRNGSDFSEAVMVFCAEIISNG